MIEERLISAQPLSPGNNEYAMRPTTLEAYVGQDKTKNQLSTAIATAKSRGESLDHTLLFKSTRFRNYFSPHHC